MITTVGKDYRILKIDAMDNLFFVTQLFLQIVYHFLSNVVVGNFHLKEGVFRSDKP